MPVWPYSDHELWELAVASEILYPQGMSMIIWSFFHVSSQMTYDLISEFFFSFRLAVLHLPIDLQRSHERHSRIEYDVYQSLTFR